METPGRYTAEWGGLEAREYALRQRISTLRRLQEHNRGDRERLIELTCQLSAVQGRLSVLRQGMEQG